MRYFLFFIVLISWITPFAAPLTEPSSNFSVKQANQQFDRINLQLSVQNLNLHDLRQAIATLSNLVLQADQCVENTQKKLNNLDQLIQQGARLETDNKNGADALYLNREQKKIASQQSQCRLFSIRAKEAITAYQAAIAQLKQAEALTHGRPLWRLLQLSTTHPLPFTDFAERFNDLDWMYSTAFSLWLALGLFVSVVLLTSVFLYYLRHSRMARRYLRIKTILIRHVILLALSLYAIGLNGYFHWQMGSPSALTAMANLICQYLITLLLIILLFKIKKIQTIFYWYALDQNYFRSLLFTGASFFAVNKLLHILMPEKLGDNVWWALSQSLLLLIELSTAIFFIYYFCRLHRHFQFLKHHRHFMQRFVSLLLIACGIMDILGYHTLAHRLAISGLATFIIVFVTFLLNQSIQRFYLLLSFYGSVHDKIRFYFGYKKEQTLTEFLILKSTLQVIVIAMSLYLIGKTWGFASYYFENVYTQLLYGIHFGNFTFYPTRIVGGVIVFCVLYLLFRAISTAVSRRQQFENEEETQVAIASILTYIGFTIAFLAGLLAAGFDFTGLAIVAGALSVGIGLGLQSIVNNFVSGLILLIEKPIKPGDRINVDGVEGIVKKIRVRSTQITTPAREDIIVPNSDLITRRVTNYMYSDKSFAIHCQVGVAYGSDTQLVQTLLLKAANEHDEVIKTGRNKPSVLFRSFGDDNLIFQVWCIIKDANKKSQVQSDLHFVIERLFREQGIQMAYPQRDIHLKVSDMNAILNG